MFDARAEAYRDAVGARLFSWWLRDERGPSASPDTIRLPPSEVMRLDMNRNLRRGGSALRV